MGVAWSKGSVSACVTSLCRRLAGAACLAVATLAVLCAQPAAAATSTAFLTWEAPTTATDGSPLTDLAGYRVHVGTAPGQYQQTIDVGSTLTYLAENLSAGNTYYFAVTAYNASGEEGPFSEEVAKSFAAGSVPATPPASFTIADALTALRYAVAFVPLAPEQLAQYDVAPVEADGTPRPDGAVNIGDAVVILRSAVGLGAR